MKDVLLEPQLELMKEMLMDTKLAIEKVGHLERSKESKKAAGMELNLAVMMAHWMELRKGRCWGRESGHELDCCLDRLTD